MPNRRIEGIEAVNREARIAHPDAVVEEQLQELQNIESLLKELRKDCGGDCIWQLAAAHKIQMHLFGHNYNLNQTRSLDKVTDMLLIARDNRKTWNPWTVTTLQGIGNLLSIAGACKQAYGTYEIAAHFEANKNVAFGAQELQRLESALKHVEANSSGWNSSGQLFSLAGQFASQHYQGKREYNSQVLNLVNSQKEKAAGAAQQVDSLYQQTVQKIDQLTSQQATTVSQILGLTSS